MHHAWLLVLLAGVRCRRGRLVQAEAALRSARSAIETFTDAGRVSALASEVEQELERALGRASLACASNDRARQSSAVLRLLNTDLSVRQIGGELFISSNTVRSHTRAIIASSASIRAQLRSLEPSCRDCSGRRRHRCENVPARARLAAGMVGRTFAHARAGVGSPPDNGRGILLGIHESSFRSSSVASLHFCFRCRPALTRPGHGVRRRACSSAR